MKRILSEDWHLNSRYILYALFFGGCAVPTAYTH
ncbi:hypothetical protein ACVIU7_000023 [Bradyrhizobium liaoningense]